MKSSNPIVAALQQEERIAGQLVWDIGGDRITSE